MEVVNVKTEEIKHQLNDFKLIAEQLVKVFTDTMSEDFLMDIEKKLYNSITKKINNSILKINDITRVAEIILLYTRAEYYKQASRLYLSSLCCFKHKEEEETLTLYMPSFWIISEIHKSIISKKRKYKHLEEEIFNEFKKYNFPVIPEERLRLRIKKYLRKENEKNLFDFIDECYCC
jgi:hypothetical protein